MQFWNMFGRFFGDWLSYLFESISFSSFFHTPGSMNRLFSDFFRKFDGVVWGVFGTSWGCLEEILEGKLEYNPGRKPLRSSQCDYLTYFKFQIVYLTTRVYNIVLGCNQ